MALGTGTERVDLPIEGMTCASCSNRINRGLNKLAGVTEADVNLATERAVIRFDPAALDVSDLRATIEAMGYRVPDDDAVDSAAVEEHNRKVLTLRLAVAIALTIPVVAVSMIPPLMFDGWQWLAFALTTPVVFWSGARFHRAALVNLRHRTATMDSLVSLGTVAAWTWSTVALLFLGAADTDAMQGMEGMASMASGDTAHVYFETASRDHHPDPVGPVV